MSCDSTNREHCSVCKLPTPAVPLSWSGTLQNFISSFVAPRLPSPERLALWSRWIIEGIRSSDVVTVRRFGSLARGVPHDIRGLRVLPADLSPVWAVQQEILHGDPPSRVAFRDWVLALPLEHNDVRRRELDLLNVAGFHAAHIVDVAGHRNVSRTTNEADAFRAASAVELHPLNLMWVPKPHWRYWGGLPEVKAQYAELAKRHAPHLWDTFVRSIGQATGSLPRPDPSFQYSYTEDDWRLHDPVYRVLRTETTRPTPQIRQIVALLVRHGMEYQTATEVCHVLEDGRAAGQFGTAQDVMKVFSYYRKRLKDDGVLA